MCGLFAVHAVRGRIGEELVAVILWTRVRRKYCTSFVATVVPIRVWVRKGILRTRERIGSSMVR